MFAQVLKLRVARADVDPLPLVHQASQASKSATGPDRVHALFFQATSAVHVDEQARIGRPFTRLLHEIDVFRRFLVTVGNLFLGGEIFTGISGWGFHAQSDL